MASDTAAKLPVIKDAFFRSEQHFQTTFDIHVDLDATSPLRLSEDIVGAINTLINNQFSNIITGMPSRRSPYFNLVEAVGDSNQVAISKKPPRPIIRRQDAPRCYDMNASIYVWWRDSIINCNEVLNDNTGIFVMPEQRSIDIDSEIDFEFVQFIMKKNEESYALIL
jgi:CMP-N,N'-diacetyllegionaminic acid synthase